MTIIRTSPVFPWDKPNAEEAPQAPGVYVFWNSESVIIYIGMSGNLRQRLLQHDQNGDISGIAWFQWHEADSEQNAREVEAVMIRKYRPPLNIQQA